MMNGYATFEDYDDLEFLLEDLDTIVTDSESDYEFDEGFPEDEDFAERRRRGRITPYRRRRAGGRVGGAPKGSSLARTAPKGYVTKAELKQTVSNIDKKFTAVNAAITKLDGQNKTINAAQDKELAKQNKAIASQSASISRLSKEVKQSREASILPLLLAQPQVELTKNEGGAVTDVKLKSDILLPVLLMSGMGGDSGSGNNTLLLALAFMNR